MRRRLGLSEPDVVGRRRFHCSALIVVVFAALLGCSVGRKDRRVSGQVFVVTNARENVRLGLVEVKAIPAKELESFVSEKLARRVELRADLPRQRELLKAMEWDAQRRLEHATRDLHAAWEEFLPHADKDSERKAYADRYFAAESKLQAAKDAMARLPMAQRAAIDSLLAYWDSGAYFMAGLPAALDSVKTDASGEFTLDVAATRRIGVAATAGRQVVDKYETYYWLVWVDPKDARSARVLLSNDNQLGSDSPESVIPGSALGLDGKVKQRSANGR